MFSIRATPSWCGVVRLGRTRVSGLQLAVQGGCGQTWQVWLGDWCAGRNGVYRQAWSDHGKESTRWLQDVPGNEGLRRWYPCDWCNRAGVHPIWGLCHHDPLDSPLRTLANALCALFRAVHVSIVSFAPASTCAIGCLQLAVMGLYVCISHPLAVVYGMRTYGLMLLHATALCLPMLSCAAW